MSRLYEIASATRDFWLDAEANWDNPELTPEDWQKAQEVLWNIEADFDHKVENCAKAIRAMEDEQASLQRELDRLTEKKRTLENRIRNFKTYVRDCMTAAGTLKVKTPLFSVAVQKSPVSLKLNESLLPRNFFVTVTEERPDKGKIRAALEGGTPVPGASLEQGTHLRIR